jgi:hypothetical protein
MDSTYIFSISHLKAITTADYTNYITCVAYKISKTVGGITADFSGIVKFDYAVDPDFTLYDELTKDQVVGWITSKFQEGEEDMIIDILAKQIERKQLEATAPVEMMVEIPW